MKRFKVLRRIVSGEENLRESLNGKRYISTIMISSIYSAKPLPRLMSIPGFKYSMSGLDSYPVSGIPMYRVLSKSGT